MTFRGPKTKLGKGFVLCLGGSETFGKFSPDPYPDLLASRLGRPVLNMGAMNAGIDLLLHDPALRNAQARAREVVLQLPGAANLSNRFFSVHPRRNDRFVKASTMMRTIYREVDFTEFTFTRHLLVGLRQVSARRFAEVEAVLRAAWVTRMREMVARLDRKPLLLWLRYVAGGRAGASPIPVTREMIDGLTDVLGGMVEVPVQASGPAGELDTMVFGPMQGPAAAHMIGPSSHRVIAEALLDAIRWKLLRDDA